MKIKRTKTITIMLLLFALTLSLVAPGATYGQKDDKGGQPTDIEPVPLKPRLVFPKQAKQVITNPEDARLLVLKFAEGTRVRVRDGGLKALLDEVTSNDEALLKRAQITKEKIPQDLAAIGLLLESYNTPFERLFTRDEIKLDNEKREGELNSGEELADLNLYYYLFPPGDVATSEYMLASLNNFSIVETAYACPPVEPAQIDIAPATPNFVMRQGYLNVSGAVDPASNGIDARYAWSRGADGRGVRIVDVEGGWNRAHEDLPSLFLCGGDPTDELRWKDHGTAVVGELVGAPNAYGVTGIAPGAEVGLSSIFRHFFFRYQDSAGAINNASGCLRAGDIILVELHRRGPLDGLTPPPGDDDFGRIAVEYWRAEFDAIQNATRRGIIVVEAAGNGSMDLDAPRYENRFNRSMFDSGAIMVGAGVSTTRAPHGWSTHGGRVDVQGWGDGVMTLGYGDAMVPGADPTDQRQWYTTGFSGTSSASPIVVGAAALIQSARLRRGMPALNSIEMRDLLARTGKEQVPGNLIGPLPNLRAAFNASGMGSVRPSEMRLVTIRESDLDVDTGLDIQDGDRVVIEGGSSIWSGEYYTGPFGIMSPVPDNGPAGWFSARAGGSFPLPGVAPYSLIGRFDGRAEYFAIGRRAEQIYIGPPARLRLRINDNRPGNGSGQFGCAVFIYR